MAKKEESGGGILILVGVAVVGLGVFFYKKYNAEQFMDIDTFDVDNEEYWQQDNESKIIRVK